MLMGIKYVYVIYPVEDYRSQRMFYNNPWDHLDSESFLENNEQYRSLCFWLGVDGN